MRTQRQLAKIDKKDEWLSGQCQMGTSTPKKNTPVKEDCIQECASFVGINYNNVKKVCYCIENLTTGNYYGFAHMDCFIYGSCGRLDAEWCGSNQNCSWNNGSCSADKESGSEYDSSLLAPEIKADLIKTAAASALPRCLAKFEGGGELPGDTHCRDRNLDQCQKKDLDANNECPGVDVWEQDPCAATESDIFESVNSQDECKNKCDEKKHIAINFSSGERKCWCIREGDLYNYNNGDESATCFIYPAAEEAEEDNASAAYCSGIKLLSECESSEDIREDCAEECATIRSNFTPRKLKDERDNHICDLAVNSKCTPHLWGVCAHRCGELYLQKNNDTSASSGSSNQGKKQKLQTEVERQMAIFNALKVNPNNNKLIEDEKQRFQKLIQDRQFKRFLETLPMQQANKAMGGGKAFENALMSNNSARMKTLAKVYLRTRDTARNRRALQLVNQSTTDNVVEIISHVTNVSDLFAEAGSDTFGSISATVSLVEPFMGVINSDNSAEGKFRSLVEFKLNLAAQLTADLGPVGSLFFFANEIAKGVNASEACTNANGSRVGCNPKELQQEIGGIALTAALETIGNGHLGDLYNIFEMGQRVVEAKTLKAIDVADVMSLSAAAMRGGCAIATFAFPLAAMPCNVGVKLIEIVRDTGIFSNPATEKFLDDASNTNNLRITHTVPQPNSDNKLKHTHTQT
jgi:hypothetical protein